MAWSPTSERRKSGPKPLPLGQKSQSRSLCWPQELHESLLQMSAADGVTASKFVAALIQAEHQRRVEAAQSSDQQKHNGEVA